MIPSLQGPARLSFRFIKLVIHAAVILSFLISAAEPTSLVAAYSSSKPVLVIHGNSSISTDPIDPSKEKRTSVILTPGPLLQPTSIDSSALYMLPNASYWP